MPTAKTTKKKMSTVTAPEGFIKVTRLYLKKASAGKKAAVGKQTNLVSVPQIEAIRIRTTVDGKKVEGMKASIVTVSGRFINVAESATDLAKMIEKAFE